MRDHLPGSTGADHEKGSKMGLKIDPLGAYKANVEAANALGLKIKSAKSDKSETVSALVETSEDENLVQFRADRAAILEEIETLQARLTNGEGKAKEYAATLVVEVDKDFNVEEATKKFVELRKAANDSRKALLNFVSEDDLKAAEKEMGIVPVVDLRGSGKAAAANSTGIKRPRISSAKVDGKNVWKDEAAKKVDFTELAKTLKSDAETVKKAAFAAAQTEELNSLAEGTVVKFKVGDHNVEVTVSGEKPGRKPAEKKDDEKKDEAKADKPAA